MKTWGHIANALEKHQTCAMVTVLSVEGSAPREAGARIIVTPEGFHGSIGGGTLEWHALAKAQGLLGKPKQHKITRHSLGPDMGQCCGGRVQLLTEVFEVGELAQVRAYASREVAGAFSLQGRLPGPDFVEHFGQHDRRLYLFGAGHVGRALVMAMAALPFEVIWIDPREAVFPSLVPGTVTCIRTDNPISALQDAAAESFVLVMTHSHPLDLEIVDAALRDSRFAYVGLIGSVTKRGRFTKRLREAGVAEQRISEMVCPIGVAGVKSKHPAAIAAATAVQLIACDELLRNVEEPLAAALISANVATGRRA